MPAGGTRVRRRAGRITAYAVVAVIALAAAAVTGARAHAEATRRPTPAELSAAAAIGVTQLWARTPAGQIFPARIGYSTDLFTNETATRLGISSSAACAASVDATLSGLARDFGCRAGIRASYADELQGVVYTVGVLAFPARAAATSFFSRMPGNAFPATGLRALAVAGTATARFGDAARQATAAQQSGPYVVIVVAGYADGRAAAASQERRDSAFSADTRLARAVAGVLSRPETVNCAAAEWSC